MIKLNLIGKTFERLKVLSKAPVHITSGGNKVGRWNCVCECGTKVIVRTNHLTCGTTKSCGCYNSDKLVKRNFKHGLSIRKNITPLYSLWLSIKTRCYNAQTDNYSYYGGKGIRVSEDWLHNPKEFICWAKHNGYKKGLEIDRINSKGNYDPSNCRFVTRSENCINRGLFKNNSSGYTGVKYNKNHSKWVSDIQINKKRISLGDFEMKKDALETRNKYIFDNELPHKLQEYRGEL